MADRVARPLVCGGNRVSLFLPKWWHMFGKIGIWQLVLVFGVFIVLFGYKKMPEIGKTLGQSLRNFKRSLTESDEIDMTPPSEEKEKTKEDSSKQ